MPLVTKVPNSKVGNGGSTLTLTNDNIGEYGSWFSKTPQSIDNFTASFNYQASGEQTLADGMAFILRNSSAGSSALGGPFSEYGGSGLGYAGISNSAAVEFNVYSGHTQGTNFATDGSTGNYYSTGAVAFWNGDEIHVELSYNGSVLTETVTDCRRVRRKISIGVIQRYRESLTVGVAALRKADAGDRGRLTGFERLRCGYRYHRGDGVDDEIAGAAAAAGIAVGLGPAVGGDADHRIADVGVGLAVKVAV